MFLTSTVIQFEKRSIISVISANITKKLYVCSADINDPYETSFRSSCKIFWVLSFKTL